MFTIPTVRVFLGFSIKLVASLPALTLTVLYLATWRVVSVIGHWPTVQDNPTLCGPLDKGLFGLLWIDSPVPLGLVPLTMCSVFVLPALMGLAAAVRAPVQKRIWTAVYILGTIALLFEPGNRLAWFLD